MKRPSGLKHWQRSTEGRILAGKYIKSRQGQRVSTTQPTWSESSEDEERRAIEQLRALPRKATELTYRLLNGWHVLAYRTLHEIDGDNGARIVVTKKFERLARTLELLYQERKYAFQPAPRKPVKSSTVGNLRKNANRKHVEPAPAALYA